MDGGVFATNPAMCALAEALNTVSPKDVVLVSLGTGERTHKRDFDEIKDWGLARLGAARSSTWSSTGCRTR